MNTTRKSRIVAMCLSVLVLIFVVWWSFGFPYITISYSQSLQPTPHANPWTELSWAVVHENGKDKEKVYQLIHQDPSQLTTASPPVGLYPLECAVITGPEEIAVLLLLEIEKVYTAEYLLDIAKLSIRLHKTSYLDHLQQAVPSDRVEWYKIQIDELIKNNEVDG